MNFEFDNEMDAILRKSRGVTDFAATGDHLDADEIAAFAENAVSEAARTRFTMHFADCSRCRTILANTFSTEIERPVAVATVTAEEATPWYSALFRAPQLAFGLGALVLVFAGFVGYVVLRNVGTAGDMAAANREEKRVEPAVSAPSNAPANVPFAATDSTFPKNSETTAPAANTPVAPANIAPQGANETSRPNQPMVPSTRPMSDDKEMRDDGYASGGETVDAVKPSATPLPEAAKKPDASVVGSVTKDERSRDEADRALSTESRKNSEDQLGVTRSAPAKPKKNQSRAVGGKTFNQTNGVWTDADYRGQSLETVKRASDEYRKLDSDLRSITDQIPGTVVIIWKSKGYRIE